MPTGQNITPGVLPQDNTAIQIWQQGAEKNERRKLLQEERARELALQKKKDDIDTQKYLDDSFDMSKYGTDNLENNEVIQNTLGAMRSQSAMAIKAGASLPQIMQMNSGGLNELKGYVAATKAGNAGIDKELTAMGKSESLDMERLRKRAIRKTYFNDDGSPKSAGDIKPMSIRQLLQDDPTSFVKMTNGQVNHGDLEDYIQKQKPINTVVDGYEDYKLGGAGMKKTLEKFKVSMLNGQEVIWQKGADGKLDPKLSFKSETVKVKDKDGKESTMKMLNDESYNQYFAGDGAKAALLAETRQRNPDIQIDPRTAEGQKRMKETALSVLNAKAQGTTIDHMTKEQLSRNPTIVVNTGDKKEQTKLEKESATSVPTLFRIKTGEIGVTEGRDPKTGLTPVNGLLPENTLWSNRSEKKADGTSSKQAFSGVYIDDDKNFWVKDNPGSAARKIDPKDEYGFFRNIAVANGMSVENYDKFFKETHPNQDMKQSSIDYKTSETQRIESFQNFMDTPDSDVTKFINKWKHRYFTVVEGTGDYAKERKAQLLAFNRKKNGKYDLQIRYDDTGKLGDYTDLSYDKAKKYLENPVTQ